MYTKFFISLLAGFFIKRKKIERKLLKFLEKNRNGFIFITGPAGFGKTTFLANFIKILQKNRYKTVFHFFSNSPVMEGFGTSTNIAIANILGQIAYYTGKDKIDISNYFMFDEGRLFLRKVINEISLEKKEKMVIIIDGLDNSKPLFEYPPFPEKLPIGVFLIYSADSKEEKEDNVFKEWKNTADLELKFAGMDNAEIRSWFIKSENEKLKEFAKNDSLIEEITKKTGGLPLYLKYLVEDIEGALKTGKDVGELLEKTSNDFEKYIQNHYEKLCQLGITEKYQKLLSALTVAKEYLSLGDMKELIDLNDNDINQMKYDKELTRWFSAICKENEVYFAFKHQIISKAFSKIMPDDVEKAEENLIKYCSNWEKNKSKYAICHYAEHLFDKLMYDELYELVREESYLERQGELDKKELQLPLNTIQLAIKAAIRQDDAEKMAEFSLRHAKYLLNNYEQKHLFASDVDDYYEEHLNLTLGDIAIVEAKSGKFKDAFGIAYKINDEFEYSRILRNIAEEQAKAGKFKDALETAEKIKEEKFLA